MPVTFFGLRRVCLQTPMTADADGTRCSGTKISAQHLITSRATASG